MAGVTRKRKRIIVKGRFAVGASLIPAGHWREWGKAPRFGDKQAQAYKDAMGREHVNRFTNEQWKGAA